MIGIQVVSRSGVPLERLALGASQVAYFGDAIGDIGRGADCTLVLPDPQRGISRRQVLITSRADKHFICPIGSNLTIEVDGRPLAPNVESELTIGAEIRIGPYLLRVVRSVETMAAEVPAPEVKAAGDKSSQGGDDPLALFGQPWSAGAGVFHGLLDHPTSLDAPPAAAAKAAQRERPAKKRKPDKSPPKESAAAAASVETGATLSGKAPKARRAGPGHQAVTRSRADEGGAAPPADGRDSEANALFASLGLPMPTDARQRAEQMRLVGQMLRAAIGGTLELLAARTIAKRELGENATMLQIRENNPLKFSPDTDTALVRLLAPPERGFKEPVDAMRDAYADLRAHQMAMLSGMRAALDEVLARFDPAALEPRLAPGALWDKLVPAARRAKLWEQYCQQYAELLREVEGDFDTMFGRAFLRAYRAQLTELASPKRLGDAEDS